MSTNIEIELPESLPQERTPYALVGRVYAKPEMSDALEKRLLTLVEPTRLEEGAMQYHVHRDRHNLNLFVFYEVWRSKEDLENHLKQPYIQSFLKDRLSYIEGDMEITWLSMASSHPS
ncbi:putative quinol monooxygenase [Kiloniella litopenaei]|uniref:putative quinol monooxygenase n=1 Tax=Kiloniella litopenaei TaxID=1549748 RepID=UPI003BAA85A5